MKALQISDTHLLEVIDLPTPEPVVGEVLLRISYVGFCGSDLNTFRGRNAMALKPVIPGHEISAIIWRVSLLQSIPILPVVFVPVVAVVVLMPVNITRPWVFSATELCASLSVYLGRRLFLPKVWHRRMLH